MKIKCLQDQHAFMMIGQRLRKAREQLGLSHQAVSERLCLKNSIIYDIEEGKISNDLTVTFVRGYIRSYAKLVHVADTELLVTLAKETPKKTEAVTLMQCFSLNKHHTTCDKWLMKCTWCVVLVVLGLTGGWWWQNHQVQKEEIATMANQFATRTKNTKVP
ncbi:cytoskeleton protein RodZ [Candidatus Gillettellia adelgis]